MSLRQVMKMTAKEAEAVNNPPVVAPAGMRGKTAPIAGLRGKTAPITKRKVPTSTAGGGKKKPVPPRKRRKADDEDAMDPSSSSSPSSASSDSDSSSSSSSSSSPPPQTSKLMHKKRPASRSSSSSSSSSRSSSSSSGSSSSSSGSSSSSSSGSSISGSSSSSSSSSRSSSSSHPPNNASKKKAPPARGRRATTTTKTKAKPAPTKGTKPAPKRKPAATSTKNKKKKQSSSGSSSSSSSEEDTTTQRRRRHAVMLGSEDEEENGGADEFDEGYGSDLIKDEEDQKKLAMMTEVEREKTLEERFNARAKWKEMMQIKAKKAADAAETKRKKKLPAPRQQRKRAAVKRTDSDDEKVRAKAAAARAPTPPPPAEESPSSEAESEVSEESEPMEFAKLQEEFSDQELIKINGRLIDPLEWMDSEDEGDSDGDSEKEKAELDFDATASLVLTRQQLVSWLDSLQFPQLVRGMLVRRIFPTSKDIPPPEPPIEMCELWRIEWASTEGSRYVALNEPTSLRLTLRGGFKNKLTTVDLNEISNVEFRKLQRGEEGYDKKYPANEEGKTFNQYLDEEFQAFKASKIFSRIKQGEAKRLLDRLSVEIVNRTLSKQEVLDKVARRRARRGAASYVNPTLRHADLLKELEEARAKLDRLTNKLTTVTDEDVAADLVEKMQKVDQDIANLKLEETDVVRKLAQHNARRMKGNNDFAQRVNERNAYKNQEVLAAKSDRMSRVNSDKELAGKTTTDQVNPFMRRPTRPKVLWSTVAAGGGGGGGDGGVVASNNVDVSVSNPVDVTTIVDTSMAMESTAPSLVQGVHEEAVLPVMEDVVVSKETGGGGSNGVEWGLINAGNKVASSQPTAAVMSFRDFKNKLAQKKG